jgi:hypothetical protein
LGYILALQNSEVYIFPQTVDGLAVCCAPEVRSNNTIATEIRPIGMRVLPAMVQVKSTLFGAEFDPIVSAVGRLSMDVVRPIGRCRLGGGCWSRYGGI